DNEIILLKCTSSYPAPLEEANLAMIQDFKTRFGVISGLSDHTLGSTAAVVAACLGAKVIEKHFILDHSIGGLDASFSLDENEFTQMVQDIRAAEKSIGNVTYELTEKQKAGKAFSRSLYVVQDLKKGEKFTEINIRSIRPGFGLHPKYLKDLIGKQAKVDFRKGDRLTKNDLK
ncbi:MAG: N-acetylneuraminate synthase family protein, partial [Flavobacteriales bacterium]